LSIGKNKGSPRGQILTLAIALIDSRDCSVGASGYFILSIEVPKIASMSLKFVRDRQNTIKGGENGYIYRHSGINI